MAAIGSTAYQGERAPVSKQYYTIPIYYNRPLDISIVTRCYDKGSPDPNNNRKYPRLSTLMQVSMMERSGDGNFHRSSITLSVDDWYRWVITISELLTKVKSIYVDNRVADTVTENDFKIVNYKGEVLSMVPLMAKVDNDYVPALRIIINDPANFVDFPLIDIKSMYNVISRIDVVTASICSNILGDAL